MNKTLLILFLASFLTGNSFSQNIPYVANSYFSNAHLMPCPYNASDTIYGYDEWEIYQTLNDEWDGPIDSSICISVDPNNIWNAPLSIPLGQIDTTRRLFIVSKYNDSSLTFAEPNFLYREEVEMNNFPLPDINYSSTCLSQACSYLFIQAQIPDSTGTADTLRTYEFGLPMAMNPIDQELLSQCYVTERFDTQYVRRVGIAIRFNTIPVSNAFNLNFFDVTYGSICTNCFSTDTAVVAYPYGPDWYYQFGDDFFGHLLLYNASTYPSEEHADPIYVYPGSIPLTTQQQITVDILPLTMVGFQPFTGLSGSPVSGQPGVFHNLTLIDDGGNLCFGFIDEEFRKGDKLIYHSGEIELSTESACMIFDNGSELRVGKNAMFDYGSQNNMGLLSFHDSATLTIESGGVLNVYNELLIREEHPENGPKQFYTTLNPGSTLRFMPGSHLSTLYSVDNSIRLNVFMKGGTLDDSGLPTEERSLINRIYDADDLIPNSFTIYPNPADDQTQLMLHASEDVMAVLSIYDCTGKLFSQQEVYLQKGMNELPCSMNSLPSGFYIMKVTYPEDQHVLSSTLVKK